MRAEHYGLSTKVYSSRIEVHAIMTQKSLDALTVDELVAEFAEICLVQDKELRSFRLHKRPELFHRIVAIVDELRRRGRDARLALTRLYDHPCTQARLKAAKYTLAVAPVPARQVLEKIEKFGHTPQRAEAGFTLQHLDEGKLKPE
jgi:hypothetical protein